MNEYLRFIYSLAIFHCSVILSGDFFWVQIDVVHTSTYPDTEGLAPVSHLRPGCIEDSNTYIRKPPVHCNRKTTNMGKKSGRKRQQKAVNSNGAENSTENQEGASQLESTSSTDTTNSKDEEEIDENDNDVNEDEEFADSKEAHEEEKDLHEEIREEENVEDSKQVAVEETAPGAFPNEEVPEHEQTTKEVEHEASKSDKEGALPLEMEFEQLSKQVFLTTRKRPKKHHPRCWQQGKTRSLSSLIPKTQLHAQRLSRVVRVS